MWFFSHVHHLVFGRTIHLNLPFSLEKNFLFYFSDHFSSLFFLLKIPVSWMLGLLDSSLYLLSFPCFPFLSVLIPNSRKWTRWYFPILLLKCFLDIGWFLTQSRTLLHPMMSMNLKARFGFLSKLLLFCIFYLAPSLLASTICSLTFHLCFWHRKFLNNIV